MGFFDYLKSKLTAPVAPTTTQGGRSATYAQFGNDIYASEVVSQCVDKIANEMKKLAPRHVIENADTLQVQAGDIADILANPNDLMTTSDFLEKITYHLYANYNVFIYPTYADTPAGRRYTGLYPLNPSQVEFGTTDTARVVVRMRFANGLETVLPYDELIHWRYKYSVDDFMGGGENGQPDNSALIDTLKLNKSLRDGMKKAANAPVNGVVRYGSIISEDKLRAAVDRFDASLKSSESGLLALDAKSEYQQIANGAKLIDKDTMEHVKKEIAAHFGVSLAILDGSATIDEKRAFYDATIEPLIHSLNQAFTKCLISKGRSYRNHRIVFYYGELLFMSYEQKIDFVEKVGGRGVLTDNQILGVFGMPPFEGGDIRRVSLNYVDTQIANQYQMTNAGSGKGEQFVTEPATPTTTEEGSATDGEENQ